MKLTAERVRELRTLSEKASPAPWEARVTALRDVPRHKQYIAIQNEMESIAKLTASEGCELSEIPDAPFIAASRQAIPDLLEDRAEDEKLIRELASNLRVYHLAITEYRPGINDTVNARDTLESLERATARLEGTL